MKCKSLPLPLLSASVGQNTQQSWCFDLACRWKYDVETFPWKIEENLKIAVEEVLVEVALQVFLGTKTKGTSLYVGADPSKQSSVHMWDEQGSLEKQ